VLVIGAGTAGLLLAQELHQRGIDVLCVESGGRHQESETHPLNEVEQLGTPYAGAAHGRFRCLGGTSTRWGGALIPFAAADTRNDDWPIGMDELAPHQAQVEAAFSLPPSPYELPEVLGPQAQHVARLAKWPPFKKRNVAQLLGSALDSEAGFAVWLDATATDFHLKDGLLQGVVMRALDGSTLTVHAQETVMACGAIESTRLLLLLDAQNKGAVRTISPQLGKGFHDHLSAVVADLLVKDRRALNRLLGFRFEAGGVMRNLRFELAADTQARQYLPACFAHVAFDAGEEGGFAELRNLFRLMQRAKLPDAAQIWRLARELPWLTKASYWRFAERRLLYPAHAPIQLHMVIDQTVRDENCIDLSPNRHDVFGQPLARISWCADEVDHANMAAATNAVVATWNASPLQELAALQPRAADRVNREMVAGGGIYHPGGSTRMGRDATQGVVDRDLRVFAVQNLRVVATSVLPTGGGANPTMTLLMLAFRCAGQLQKNLQPHDRG